MHALVLRIVGITALVASLAALGAPPARAQSPAGSTCIDTVLVVDQSWSMWNASGTFEEDGRKLAVNDPHHLRLAAARLYVDLAEDGDRVGVVLFGENAWTLPGDEAGRLVPLGRGEREALRRRDLRRAILGQAERVEPATNTPGALDLAATFFDGPKACERYVVLLTDGRPFVPRTSTAAARAATLDAARRLAAAGVRIVSMLLGADVDEPLAREMARLTGGTVLRVPEAGRLLRAFSELIAMQQPTLYQDQIVVRPNGDARFSVKESQRVIKLVVVFTRLAAEGALLRELQNEGRWALRPPCMPGALEVAADCVDDPNYYLVALSRSPAALNGPWAAQTVPGQALDGLLLARSTLAAAPYQRGRELTVPYAPGNPLLFPVTVAEDGNDRADVPVEVTTSGERLGSVRKPLRNDLLDPNGTVYWETFEVPVPEPLRADISIGSAGEPLRLTRSIPLEPAPTDWRLRPGEGDVWGVFSSPPLTVTAHGVLVFPREVRPDPQRVPLVLRGSQLVPESLPEGLPCAAYERHAFVRVETAVGPVWTYAAGSVAPPAVTRLRTERWVEPVETRGEPLSMPLAWEGPAGKDLQVRGTWRRAGAPLDSPPRVWLEDQRPAPDRFCAWQGTLRVDGLDRLPPGEHDLGLELVDPRGRPVESPVQPKAVRKRPPLLRAELAPRDFGEQMLLSVMRTTLTLTVEPRPAGALPVEVAIARIERDGVPLGKAEWPVELRPGARAGPPGGPWRQNLTFAPPERGDLLPDLAGRLLPGGGRFRVQLALPGAEPFELTTEPAPLAIEWRMLPWWERIPPLLAAPSPFLGLALWLPGLAGLLLLYLLARAGTTGASGTAG
ncbi:MAG: VWA domain-containing protein [Chloroflexi bacterium]|nr:VWA domain-containing protein [Chloroflexota bacterium]